MSAATPSVIRLPRDTSAQHAARPAFVGSDPLTYGEFTARVEAVAARLLSLGTRTGDRIAVWMDKQPRYAEAIVAALEAGCAYVPLDGGQPVSRVRTILADAEPVVLFTDAHHAALLGDDDLPASVTTVVAVGDALPDTVGGIPVAPWESWEQGRAGRVTLLPSLTPGDLAALLYTSGSTGTPKGVQISHGALANFVAWARDELDVGPDDVFAGHASFNFDLSTFDLFTALSCGAAVWIVPDAATKDVTALAEGIRRHRITVWYSVPSVLHLLTTSAALTPSTPRACATSCSPARSSPSRNCARCVNCSRPAPRSTTSTAPPRPTSAPTTGCAPRTCTGPPPCRSDCPSPAPGPPSWTTPDAPSGSPARSANSTSPACA